MSSTDESGECIYCSRIVTLSDWIRPASDDTWWESEAKQHEANCEWIATRAHQREIDEDV